MLRIRQLGAAANEYVGVDRVQLVLPHWEQQEHEKCGDIPGTGDAVLVDAPAASVGGLRFS